MRRRTRAREAALQFLYQHDLRSRGDALADASELAIRAYFAESIERGQMRDDAGFDFAERLILGTIARQGEIDELLRAVARNWQLERMATIDRNILRMAVHELLHFPEIPPKVTINEAIELAKRFSTANSGGFVNGILDRIRLDHHVEPTAATPS